MHDRGPVTESTAFPASAFTPETATVVQSGTLLVSHSGLQFSSSNQSVTLPLDGLLARRGGHNNEQLFFEHPAHPGWSVFTSDDRLLHHPVLLAHPELGKLVRSVSKARTATPLPVKVGIGCLAVLLGLIALLFLSRDKLADFIIDKIPASFEQSLGQQVFESIKKQGNIVEDSEWAPHLEKITSRLLPVAADSGYEFQFHIQQDTNVNAFALPGGHIVVLTGLLENAKSAEEVAGVLAHEMAHVTRRHSVRNLLKSAGLLVLVQAVLGDSSGAIAIVVEGSRFLLEQSFSRDFEREADDTGWAYLLEAKIDPRGMTRFFETLSKLAAEGEPAGALELLSTHPTSRERIERLEQKWQSLAPAPNFVPLDPWPDRKAIP